MEDFFYAGGLPRADEAASRDQPRTSTRITVTGRTLGENIAGARSLQRRRDPPARQPDLRRRLAGGAEGQPRARRLRHQAGACDPRFLTHTGPALVFDSYPAMKEAVDDENLDVTADHVLVLRNAGPQGGPGMPEWGMLPMPKKLLKQGIRDMLRLSDARMSGTSYGACVLHVSPESLSAARWRCCRPATSSARRPGAHASDMEVADDELARRRAAWQPPEPPLRARLRLDVLEAHRAGRQGLRLRFPARPTSARRSASPTFSEISETMRRHVQSAKPATSCMTRQHRHALHRALQARPAQPVHPGRAPARARRPQHGRRGLHAALHPGARGPEPAHRVPRPRPSAARGGRGMPAGRGAGHRQPQGRPRRVGRRHPGHAPDDARRRRRRHRRRLPRLRRDRRARHSPPTTTAPRRRPT